MGEWAKKYFKQEQLPEFGYVFAGTANEIFKKSILSNFDEVLFQETGIFEKYIVRKQNTEYVLIFQVFGAPMIVDLLHILKDGDVKKIIFFGAAYALHDTLAIGDCVLPVEAQSLEGILQTIENVKHSNPDKELACSIMTKLICRGEKCIPGKVVSVPSVFAKPKPILYDKDADVLEMETAGLFYYAQRLTIKCAGILVVSDTKRHALYNSQEKRYEKTVNIFKVVLTEL